MAFILSSAPHRFYTTTRDYNQILARLHSEFMLKRMCGFICTIFEKNVHRTRRVTLLSESLLHAHLYGFSERRDRFGYTEQASVSRNNSAIVY